MYNPTKVFGKDPVSGETILQSAKVQLNLELIAQETKNLRTQIDQVSQSQNNIQKTTQQNGTSFMHDFLFLG